MVQSKEVEERVKKNEKGNSAKKITWFLGLFSCSAPATSDVKWICYFYAQVVSFGNFTRILNPLGG